MAVAAGEIVTSPVTYPGEGVALSGFLARPADREPKPAVVIIHEWWGLNDHIKDIAQRFARENFVALAADLYSRLGNSVTKDPDEAAKLMESLESQQALKDLNAAVRYLKQQPFVDGWKLGTIGFCMGGTFALMLASHNSDIKAAVPFYGQIPPTDNLKYLLCPILYIYGEQDGWIQKADVERLRQGLSRLGRPGEVRTYPACPHAFFNDTRADAYRPKEAQDAWQRTLAFLRAHLGA
ncbi:MAG: dienelactone hydrolase family protein [Candidatus Omnitrophica bacterium]|nr:dienelactone hydrolase family protein [Candidatus Omnitrophota bacterium]